MKFKFSKNKQNNVIVLTFYNKKHFDILKISKFLDIKDSTIYLELISNTSISKYNHFEICDYKEISTNSLYILDTSNQFYTFVNILMADKSVSNILIFDQKYLYKDDVSLISDIKNGDIRYFIDINSSENQVLVFMNTTRYPELTKEKALEYLR